MPNHNTSEIKPINRLLHRYTKGGKNWIDPFAKSCSIAETTNDLNPTYYTTYNEDYKIFLQRYIGQMVKGIIVDPPYSPRQITECYNSIGLKATQEDTQGFYHHVWNYIEEIMPRYVIQMGWHSNGRKHIYDIVELLLVQHGGSHNDTIVTVWEYKNDTLDDYF